MGFPICRVTAVYRSGLSGYKIKIFRAKKQNRRNELLRFVQYFDKPYFSHNNSEINLQTTYHGRVELFPWCLNVPGAFQYGRSQTIGSDPEIRDRIEI